MSDHQDILGSTLDPEALNLGDCIVVSGKIVSNPVIPGPVIQELAPPQASFQTPSYAAPPTSSKVKQAQGTANWPDPPLPVYRLS